MDKHNTILFPYVEAAPTGALFFKFSDSPADKDLKIWSAFRNGNREALAYIFNQHASNLFSYGHKFTKNQELVLDCIQDLFVELWNRRQSLNETTSIKFYLLRALRRRIARTIQGTRRFESVSDDFRYLEEKIHFSVEHFVVQKETEESTKIRLRRAIEDLTKRQREAIYLKFFQGLDNEAIASVMDLSSSSVNTLMSQAIRALRSALR
jgi:RNA polymerase sigma factor (sigma-70 family)